MLLRYNAVTTEADDFGTPQFELMKQNQFTRLMKAKEKPGSDNELVCGVLPRRAANLTICGWVNSWMPARTKNGMRNDLNNPRTS